MPIRVTPSHRHHRASLTAQTGVQGGGSTAAAAANCSIADLDRVGSVNK